MANSNNGPLLTSLINGALERIPPEFRAKLGIRIKVNKATLEEGVTPLSTAVIESRLEQELTNERKRTDTELVDTTGTELVAEIRTPDGLVGTVTRKLVPEGTGIALDGLTIDTTQMNLGNGYVDQSVTTVEAWPVLEGNAFDNEIGASIDFTEEKVTPGTPAADGGEGISVEPLTPDLSKKTTKIKPTEALDAYYQSFPTRTSLALPNVLESVAIVWNYAQGSGTRSGTWQGAASGLPQNLNGDESGSAQGSASVMPDLQITMREVWSRNIPTTTHFFFLPMPVTAADLLTRVSALAWPVFQPKGYTIALHGQKVSVAAEASARASLFESDTVTVWDKNEGSGTSQEVATMNNSVTIPPTIHGLLNFTGSATMSIAASATASAGWTAYGDFPPTDVDVTTPTLNASGAVKTTSLPATTPAAIPTTGIYLIDSKVEPYNQWGYARCMVETLDASVFAP